MYDQDRTRLFSRFLLAVVVLVAGCASPATQQTDAPATPVVEASLPPTSQPAGTVTAAPQEFTDMPAFKAALLESLMDQDSGQLHRMMSPMFLEGGWRADASDASPADATRILYDNYLMPGNKLAWVQDANLTELMGGNDPLSLPRSDAGVFEAALMRGWGKDGRDEAVIFIARDTDNTLKWHGWIVIPGGFSGARYGGLQLYENDAYNFRFYLPKDTVIEEASPSNVTIMAPGVGHPGVTRAAALINIEPANGRTVMEITEQIKADLGPNFDIQPGTAMGLDKAMALVLSGLPGQDVNRQLFVVYNDLLYRIIFVPDDPETGEPYRQMEDLYAMIVNTFHFTD